MERKVHLIVMTCIGILFAVYSPGQTTFPLTGHPRLVFLPSMETALKNKLASTPLLNKVHNNIISECNKLLTLPAQQRAVTGGNLNVAREATRRIGFLSYAYRMTGDNRYAARAETEMLAMAAFTDWEPSNQLSFTEMTLAMAIGYDWLYNHLSPDSRLAVANAIKQKGIAETVGTKAEKFFLQDKKDFNNNINSILNCNACIAMGVAAVYDEDPAYYQTLIDRAVNLVKFPMGVYQYNGAYPESVMYWDYGTSYLFLMIDMLQQMWGTDRDLLKTDGLLQTGNFGLHMHGNATQNYYGGNPGTPGYRVFNFGDGVEFYGPLFSMYGLAHFAPGKANMYFELKKLSISQSIFSPMLGFLPFLLLWSKDLSFEPSLSPAENSYIAQGKSAVAAFLSGWNSNDIYLGLKGGTPIASHCHMDAGSFVMEAMDFRWAMDYGNGTSTGTSKWDIFNFTNLAHNTLIINGNRQIADGYAPVGNLIDTPDRKSADIDLTSLYAGDVTSCIRTGAIVSNRYVEIKDELKAGTKPLTVRWNMVTQALPTQVNNKIIQLSLGTKKLYLIFEGTNQVTPRNWSPKSPGSPDANAGSFAVGFEYPVAAGASSSVTVRLVPEGDPVLSGINLTCYGKQLNEDFESFPQNSLSGNFVLWKMNPDVNSATKAILGEVVANPFKSAINNSDNVLKIVRQDNSNVINADNAPGYTNRGLFAYGYDLRLRSNSIVEFKYYKDAPGSFYLRIYDGNGNVLGKGFVDPKQGTAGYTTAQWRTAQFNLGTLNLSNFNYTISGNLSISVENTETVALQANELTLYLDDVKLLPLSDTAVRAIQENQSFQAYFDAASGRICAFNLPENTKTIRLFDPMGRLIRDVEIYGSKALIDCEGATSSVFIVHVLTSNGIAKSIKVFRNQY